MRRMVLAILAAAFAFAGGLLSSERVEAGGPGPGQGYDTQDQYAQERYAGDQYAQGQYAQGQYTQDQYSQGQFAIDQFYDALAPYGDWVDHPGHGYVWLPRTVGPDWRPFTVGNWLHTEDYGWYWQSYEPFAWAVYHYGRWGFDPEYGWYWVPGDTWAPAWVQWRYGSEYVGWAPEAPIPHGGYAYGGVESYAPAPAQDAWVFVEPRYLAYPAVRSYALPRTSISIAFSRTTYVNRPVYRDGYVYNYGMPRRHWSKVTGRYLEPRRLHRGHTKARPKGWKGRGHRDVYVYAPRVKKGVRPHRPPKKIAHKPPRKKAYSANRNRAARTVPPRPLGPRGVMNPDYRRPAAGSGRHPLARYDALGPRKGPHARPAATKPQHAKPKDAKHKNAKHRNAKSHVANRNPGARSGPQRPLGPRGVTNPSPRGPAAGGGRHPLAHYDALGPRKAPHARPAATKPQHAKPKHAKSNAARSKPNTSKGAKNRSVKSGSANSGSAKNGSAKKGPAKTKSARTPSRARAMGLAPPNRRPGAKQQSHRRPAGYAAHLVPKPSAPARTASKPKKKASASKGPRPKQASARAGKPKQARPAPARSKSARSKSARVKSARAKPAHVKTSKAKQGGAKSGARRQSNGQGRNGGKGRGHDGGKRG